MLFSLHISLIVTFLSTIDMVFQKSNQITKTLSESVSFQ